MNFQTHTGFSTAYNGFVTICFPFVQPTHLVPYWEVTDKLVDGKVKMNHFRILIHNIPGVHPGSATSVLCVCLFYGHVCLIGKFPG